MLSLFQEVKKNVITYEFKFFLLDVLSCLGRFDPPDTNHLCRILFHEIFGLSAWTSDWDLNLLKKTICGESTLYPPIQVLMTRFFYLIIELTIRSPQLMIHWLNSRNDIFESKTLSILSTVQIVYEKASQGVSYKLVVTHTSQILCQNSSGLNRFLSFLAWGSKSWKYLSIW